LLTSFHSTAAFELPPKIRHSQEIAATANKCFHRNVYQSQGSIEHVLKGTNVSRTLRSTARQMNCFSAGQTRIAVRACATGDQFTRQYHLISLILE